MLNPRQVSVSSPQLTCSIQFFLNVANARHHCRCQTNFAAQPKAHAHVVIRAEGRSSVHSAVPVDTAHLPHDSPMSTKLVGPKLKRTCVLLHELGEVLDSHWQLPRCRGGAEGSGLRPQGAKVFSVRTRSKVAREVPLHGKGILLGSSR